MLVPTRLLRGAGGTSDSREANSRWCNLPRDAGSEEAHVRVAVWL